MARDIEQFTLLNVRSQLRRAAQHAFAYYHGAIPRAECERVVDESYALLDKKAHIRHHLVPLAEKWSIDRLRQVGITTGQLVKTVPEVAFVDRANTGPSQMAAVLLQTYARGRVNVSSAGSAPGDRISESVLEVMAELDLDLSSAFPKPVTDEVLTTLDVLVVIGDPALDLDPAEPALLVRWDTAEPATDQVDDVRRARDEIDQQVLRLLADLLGRATSR